MGERTPISADELDRRLTPDSPNSPKPSPGLLPANVAHRSSCRRLRSDAPRSLQHEHAVARHLAADTDYVALCHWNANVDNAWFWRDADDALHCGLMDWGCVSQMNVGMALWGAMSGAETVMWDRHLDELAHVCSSQKSAAAAGRISTRTDCAGTPCSTRR